MKILQINCVYKTGSTGKITYDIHTGLKAKGIDSIVCYGRGDKVREPGVYKTCGEFYSYVNHFAANMTGLLYGGCTISTNRLISVIKRDKPDIVHLQCINGFFVNIYRLIDWLKANRIRTVLTLHAEFMYTGGCGYSFDCNQWSTREGCGHSMKCPRYRSDIQSRFFDRTSTMWKKMKKGFDGFGNDLIITSVSSWLMERAERSPILQGKQHCVVLNGLDTTVFHPYESSLALREKLGIDKKVKIIFHATQGFNDNPDHIKGGYYVIELAKRLPKIQFVVAGLYEHGLKVPENILLLGQIRNQKRLAELYSMADLTVLTSRKETFSMVTAETLCCGTPIVGFKAGAPEMIALKEYSKFINYGDMESFVIAINEFLNTEFDYMQMMHSASIYSRETMVENYIKVYQQLMEK